MSVYSQASQGHDSEDIAGVHNEGVLADAQYSRDRVYSKDKVAELNADKAQQQWCGQLFAVDSCEELLPIVLVCTLDQQPADFQYHIIAKVSILVLAIVAAVRSASSSSQCQLHL
eukprot:16426-Heterococcus_DN1.PRE.7